MAIVPGRTRELRRWWKETVLVCTMVGSSLAMECILVSSRGWSTGFSASKTRLANVTAFFPVSTVEEGSCFILVPVALDRRP